MKIKLIFVYNANSGILNSYMEGLHKIVSPSTYNCNLCAITFGVFKEDSLWKEFRKTAPYKMKFYHLDEFYSQYNLSKITRYQYKFPIIFSEENGELEVFITSEELNKLNSSEELIELITERLPVD